MRLTRSVSYAVAILLRVHAQGNDGPMTAAEISRGCDFPPRFLYRVLRRLVDAGLMTGTSGPGGGYSLALPARQINLLSVVDAVDGGVEPPALETVNTKHRRAVAAVNELGDRNCERFRRDLAKMSIARLDAVSRVPTKKRAARRA
mgnify:CR=1 FL=1